MKTAALKNILIVTALAAASTFALFVSCSNIFGTSGTDAASSSSEKGTLTLSASSRAIVPSSTISLSSDVTKLRLSGTCTSNSSLSFTAVSWETSTTDGTTTAAYDAMNTAMSAGTILCDTGTWSFTLTAYIGSSGSYKAVLVKTITGKSIVTGQNSLEFGTMEEATSNNTSDTVASGAVDVTVAYPLTSRVSSVKAALYTSMTGTSAVSGTEQTLTPVSDTAYTVEYKNTAVARGSDSGWYYLRFTFYRYKNGNSANAEEVMNTFTELVHVAPGLTSSAARTITDLNTLYTITYERDSGSWSTSYTTYPLSFNADESVTLPAIGKIYKTAYYFAGWYKTIDYSGSAVTSIATGTTADQTLYAKWVKAPYMSGTVIYANGCPLIVTSATTGSAVYYDADGDGIVDTGDYALSVMYPDTWPSTNNISSYTVSADSGITMTSGTLGTMNVTGSSSATIRGGTITTLAYSSSGSATYSGGTISTATYTSSAAATVSGATISKLICSSGSQAFTVTSGTITNIYSGTLSSLNYSSPTALTLSSSSATITTMNYSSSAALTVSSGTITTLNYTSTSNPKLTGGTITTMNYSASAALTFSSGTVGTLNYTSSANLSISGGTISTLICKSVPTLSISGGTVSSLTGSTVTTALTITGGTLTGETNSSFAAVNISGAPSVGKAAGLYSTGIYLSQIAGYKITVTGTLTGSDKSIVLIANATDADTIIASSSSAWCYSAKFYLRNAKNSAPLSVTNNTTHTYITIVASVSLPDKTVVQKSDGTYVPFDFSGENLVNTVGTILSIWVDNGTFTIPQTYLASTSGSNCTCMGVYSASGTITYETTLYTTRTYTYVQFVAPSNSSIAYATANAFATAVKFTKASSLGMTVKINLETVSATTISSNSVTYYNGSFYQQINSGAITWGSAYYNAKARSFNGLQGYLLTITTAAENAYVHDKVGATTGWIGGTRLKPSSYYDYSSYTTQTSESTGMYYNGTQVANSYWSWACGPEAGQIFYTTTTRAAGGTTPSGMFSSWNGSVEPNNSDGNYGETCTQFVTDSGTPSWNDLSSSSTTPTAYIVEFTPYANAYTTQVATDKPISGSNIY